MENLIRKRNAEQEQFYFYFYFCWGFYYFYSAGYLLCKKIQNLFSNEVYKVRCISLDRFTPKGSISY
ncbi:MAG: hypothetical protein PWQ37_1633 [Candidatus Petromonas sp.]|jgi:hypothetical protein|nr:hypothetical protein [Candidatus Petromonas sp.]